MINDFTYLNGNAAKVSDTLGDINGKMLLAGAKRYFGANSKVFYKHSISETRPIYLGSRYEPSESIDNNLVLIEPNEDRGVVLIPYSLSSANAPYDLEYKNQYCMTPIASSLEQFKTKTYFSVDLDYVLAVSSALTTFDFSRFTGEGERILKAWIHVMTYGVKASDGETIMLQSTKNEYGKEVPNRVIVRNSTYGNTEASDNGAPYAESKDGEWALSAEDYSKVQALNVIMSALVQGNDFLYSKPIVDGIIRGISIDRFKTPYYLTDLLKINNVSAYNV
jgi:hypothetical protein